MGTDKGENVRRCLFHRIASRNVLRLGMGDFERLLMRNAADSKALSVFRGKRLSDVDSVEFTHCLEKPLNAGMFHEESSFPKPESD